MDFYKNRVPIIDSVNDLNAAFLGEPGVIRGGMVRPDRSEPPAFGDPPAGMAVFDESEWDAVFDEQERLESSLEHLFLPAGIDGPAAFVNLDQNGDGHCWCYSTGHALMLARLRDRLPPVRLNPHSIAAALGRFDGGWCGLSARYARDNGCAVEGTGRDEFPLHSNSKARLTAAVLDRAKQYRIAEDWYDTAREVWDQSFNKKQLATCGLSNVPAPSDFNFMSHSVCQVRWVRIERGSWGPLVLNSWKGWGWRGLGVIRGRYAVADGAVGVRASLASV